MPNSTARDRSGGAHMALVKGSWKAGDEVVSASTLYGGTYTQFDVTFRRFGINVNAVCPGYTDTEIIASAVNRAHGLSLSYRLCHLTVRVRFAVRNGAQLLPDLSLKSRRANI